MVMASIKSPIFPASMVADFVLASSALISPCMAYRLPSGSLARHPAKASANTRITVGFLVIYLHYRLGLDGTAARTLASRLSCSSNRSGQAIILGVTVDPVP